jgi:hypothetical protein
MARKIEAKNSCSKIKTSKKTAPRSDRVIARALAERERNEEMPGEMEMVLK